MKNNVLSKLIWLVVCVLCFSAFTIAQPQTDTIPQKPVYKPLSNIIFQFDNRRERYYDVRGRMNGLKIGLEFYKRVRFGLAFYTNNDFYRIEAPSGVDSTYRTALFSYSTLFTELVVFRNFRWELSLVGGTGGGSLNVNSYNTIGPLTRFVSNDIINDVRVFDFGGTGHFKVMPWLGIGFGSGFRRVYNLDDANLRTAYNDPYLEFKLKLFLGYAYRSIFKPQTIEKERIYYLHRSAERKAYIQSFF